jgi:cobalt-zinc-cadmium efflux system protein
VTAVHDLPIWGMSTTHVAVTAHLVRPGAGDDDAMLAQAARVLHDRFRIEHSTLQVERSEAAANCKQAPPGVV